MASSPPKQPITLRAAVLVVIAMLIGLLGGGLRYLSTHDVADSVLTGCIGAGAALYVAHRLIGS